MKILIIGNGNLAYHLCSYFESLFIPFETSPLKSESIREIPKDISKVFLAVQDRYIEKAYHDLRVLGDFTFLHGSGSYFHPPIKGLHFLASFKKDHSFPGDYKNIPIVYDSPDDLLEKLPNPKIAITGKDKAQYHALASMASNFPVLLWTWLQADFEKMGLSKNQLAPLLSSSLDNYLNLNCGLTGPIARGDHSTIEKHLHTLKNHPLEPIYQSFLKTYQEYKI